MNRPATTKVIGPPSKPPSPKPATRADRTQSPTRPKVK